LGEGQLIIMGEPQQNSPREIVHRVGTFFLLISVGLIVFFLLSEAAGEPTFEYFCGSTILGALGFFFRAQYKREVVSSGRFAWMRKLFRGKKE
jgi:hypothetical protein